MIRVLFFCLVLAGCGGGCVPPDRLIQFEGDSIGRSYGAGDDGKLLEQLLGERVKVIQTAQAGSTSRDRVFGTTGYAPFPSGVTGDIYVTNFGVNDSRFGVTLDEYKANLRTIAAHKGAVLVTPTPMDTSMTNLGEVDDSAYAEAVRQVGKETGVPVIDVHAYVLSVPDWQGMMIDGIHPSLPFYAKILREKMAPELLPLVAACTS